MVREECERRFAGEESSGRALRDAGRGGAGSRSDMPHRDRAGRAPRPRGEGNTTMAPEPGAIALPRHPSVGSTARSTLATLTADCHACSRAPFAGSRAHDERCRTQSVEEHNRRPYRPPLVSQPRQSYGFRHPLGSPQPDAHDISRPDCNRKDRRLPRHRTYPRTRSATGRVARGRKASTDRLRQEERRTDGERPLPEFHANPSGWLDRPRPHRTRQRDHDRAWRASVRCHGTDSRCRPISAVGGNRGGAARRCSPAGSCASRSTASG